MCARVRISVSFWICARVGDVSCAHVPGLVFVFWHVQGLDMLHVHSAIWSTCYPQDDLLFFTHKMICY